MTGTSKAIKRKILPRTQKPDERSSDWYSSGSRRLIHPSDTLCRRIGTDRCAAL
ncbi:hypothetical protein NG2371_03360 [Nocardia gamkensis]|nr:hypothetical protein [Nocardia gamkensis]